MRRCPRRGRSDESSRRPVGSSRWSPRLSAEAAMMRPNRPTRGPHDRSRHALADARVNGRAATADARDPEPPARRHQDVAGGQTRGRRLQERGGHAATRRRPAIVTPRDRAWSRSVRSRQRFDGLETEMLVEKPITTKLPNRTIAPAPARPRGPARGEGERHGAGKRTITYSHEACETIASTATSSPGSSRTRKSGDHADGDDGDGERRQQRSRRASGSRPARG